MKTTTDGEDGSQLWIEGGELRATLYSKLPEISQLLYGIEKMLLNTYVPS
jgi:hypothetical protein